MKQRAFIKYVEHLGWFVYIRSEGGRQGCVTVCRFDHGHTAGLVADTINDALREEGRLLIHDRYIEGKVVA